MPKYGFRDDDDWDRMSVIPAKVGPSFIEELMAAPNHVSVETLSEPVRLAVVESIAQLCDKDRFLVEARYIWGYSYAKITDMMGYASKASAWDAVQKALSNLKKILVTEPAILDLIGEPNDDME
jgi:DNA-directed RNA polymerase specialized sigma24 family protein